MWENWMYDLIFLVGGWQRQLESSLAYMGETVNAEELGQDGIQRHEAIQPGATCQAGLAANPIPKQPVCTDFESCLSGRCTTNLESNCSRFRIG
jgi:hypothetical protein